MRLFVERYSSLLVELSLYFIFNETGEVSPSMSCQQWSWAIHMQKLKVNGQLVVIIESKQTDGRTTPTNAVGVQVYVDYNNKTRFWKEHASRLKTDALSLCWN